MRTCLARLHFLLLAAFVAPASAFAASEAVALARVRIAGPVLSYQLPVQALLQDARGQEYLLVFASMQELNAAVWPFEVLDPQATPAEFFIATEMRPGSRDALRGTFTPALDDGVRWILRASEQEAEQLANAGFAVERLSSSPLVWPTPGSQDPWPEPPPRPDGPPFPDPRIQQMTALVESTNLWWLLQKLTGNDSVLARSAPGFITTRHSYSGAPIRRALDYASERFKALGLETTWSPWWTATATNDNLIGTLPGIVAPTQYVLITAHLDDRPSGVRAPGADDNATGSAAVLIAAGIAAQHQFEKSIRFILFTGEEQGLYGSSRYALNAQTNGEHIVGVLNLDMIGWNGTGGPIFRLHTRSISNPGFPADLAIAAVFTNVVPAYQLDSNLAPAISADGMTASDHAPFWTRGYAAILATEDYPADSTPYYHTTNDTAAHLNYPFFTAAARAAVATMAHLAGPVQRLPFDVVEVANSDWSEGVRGGRVFYARHVPGASDGADAFDVAAWSVPFATNAVSLDLSSAPYRVALVNDSRSPASESVFLLDLATTNTAGQSFSTSNALRFDFPAPPSPDRTYAARIRVGGRFIGQAEDFLCVTDLRTLTGAGGQVRIPVLSDLPPIGVYGSCEISARLIQRSLADCPLRLVSSRGAVLEFTVPAQVGVPIIDTLETTPAPGYTPWTGAASFAHQPAPDPSNFDSGWAEAAYTLDLSKLPPASARFFRLRREYPGYQ